MNERVLKWATGIFAVLTIGFCVLTFYLPKVRDASVASREQQEALEAAAFNLGNVQKPQEVVSAGESIQAGQLQIEVPKKTSEKSISITNDYLTQQIYVHIPTTSKDYFSQYQVKGSCDYIESISYYEENGQGVIALKLNQVMEHFAKLDGDKLILTFVDPHDLWDKVIVVDAGHGGRDGGAAKLGIMEKDLNLAILLELKALLDEEENIRVYYTRLEDAAPTLDQRVELANKAHADLFISIHNNTVSKGWSNTMVGTQAMYSESDTSELSSKKLARIFLDSVSETMGFQDAGMVKGDKIRIINRSEVPMTLVEVGFMSNREELKKLNSEEYQKLAAQGLYDAIQKAFKEGY